MFAPMPDALNALLQPLLLSNLAAAAVFVACWLGYEPVMRRLRGGLPSINQNLDVVRAAWMRRMLARDVRIMDTNLIGHVLNSASFFASTNLLVIAAAAGLLFGGEDTLVKLREVAILERAPDWLLETKIALVVMVLATGLLDLIWAIRQLNYCVALVGAAPERDAGHALDRFCEAAAGVINPAMASFNRGVRAYYFALAAAAWLIAGWAMVAGAAAAVWLLARRQSHSEAAHAAARARAILEQEAAAAAALKPAVRNAPLAGALPGSDI